MVVVFFFFFFQAEDGIRDVLGSRGLGDVYKRQYDSGVSNPVCSPRLRASTSVAVQQAAFATGVPPDIYAFHRYTRNSACPP